MRMPASMEKIRYVFLHMIINKSVISITLLFIFS